MALQAGQNIAQKYVLERLVGHGATGRVWRAHHRILDCPVAIKLLNGDVSAEQILRFHREAQAAALLRSSHVVHVLDSGVEGDQFFIVMELLEGEDLASRLRRAQRLDADTTHGMLRQLKRVLRKAHAAGIVHRDLKPANIFLCANDDTEILKILDFGVAKSLFKHGITEPGAMLGTPAYMSPEQALGGGNVDHLADLWSLGVIAYRMLTGLLPFRKTGVVATLRAIMQCDFVPPARHVPSLGFAVDDFFSRAFAPAPEHRFQDVTTFVDSLAGALGLAPELSYPGVTIEAWPHPTTPSRASFPTSPSWPAPPGQAATSG